MICMSSMKKGYKRLMSTWYSSSMLSDLLQSHSKVIESSKREERDHEHSHTALALAVLRNVGAPTKACAVS